MTQTRAWPLVAALLLVACQGNAPEPVVLVTPAAGQPVTPAAGPAAAAPITAPVAPIANDPTASLPPGFKPPAAGLVDAARTVTTVRAPRGSERQLITRFWSYGKDAPYAVTTFEAADAGTNPENGHPQTRFEGDVQVPATGKAAYALRQVEPSTTLICPAPAVDPLSDQSVPGTPDRPLDQPHHVTGVGDSGPWAGNAEEFFTLTDELTGTVLRTTYDQEWTHFAFTVDGKTTALAFVPDGSYLVDGEPAEDEAAAIARLLATPVLEALTPEALAMLAARIGRHAATGTRGQPACNAPSVQDYDRTGSVQLYRTLGADSPDPAARAFALTNGLVKALVSP